MKLTTKTVASLALPDGKRTMQISDDVQRGLILQVNRGSKTWNVRGSLNKRQVFFRIGSFPGMGLAEARRQAAEAMGLIDQGKDPRGVVSTVSEAWDAYWPKRAGQLKHPAQDLSKWTRLIAPILAPVPLGKLSKADFTRLQAYWDAQGQGAGQHSLLRITRHFEAWLLDRDLIDRVFVPRRVVLPDVGTHPVPPLDAVRGLLRWCEGQGTRGDVVALLALTGARSDMVMALRWSEWQDDRLVWPGDRMKAGVAFSQPLSRLSQAILEARPKNNSPWVFRSEHGGEGPVKLDLSRWFPRTPMAGYPAHSLRKALVTHGGAAFSWPPHVQQALLAHSPGTILGQTTAVYSTGDLFFDERRAALEQWAGLIG